jgi:hypothetical protein
VEVGMVVAPDVTQAVGGAQSGYELVVVHAGAVGRRVGVAVWNSLLQLKDSRRLSLPRLATNSSTSAPPHAEVWWPWLTRRRCRDRLRACTFEGAASRVSVPAGRRTCRISTLARDPIPLRSVKRRLGPRKPSRQPSQ